MRILLVRPSAEVEKGVVTEAFAAECLALEMLGAMVPEHEVELLDLDIEPGLEEKLDSFKPDLVGVSCHASMVIYNTQDVLERTKKHNPETFTLTGGIPVSFLPEELNKDYVDALVIGEGEITFRELVRALDRGEEYKNIEGIAYREDGQLVFTPPRAFIEDIDSLPFPNRELSKKYFDEYVHFISQTPLQQIYSSRGCPHRCIFCNISQFFGRKIRYHSPQRVMKELEQAEAQAIDFVDDNFLQNTRRAERIAQLAKEKGIHKKHLYMLARADNIVRSPHLIEMWREIADELFVGVGIEGINDIWLSTLHKDVTREVNDEALKILKANDVNILAAFVLDPDAEREDFDKIARYVVDRDITFPSFFILTPGPGTPLYKEMSGRIATKDWRLYDARHAVVTTKLPLEEFYEQYDALWEITGSRTFNYIMNNMELAKVNLDLIDRVINVKRRKKASKK